MGQSPNPFSFLFLLFFFFFFSFFSFSLHTQGIIHDTQGQISSFDFCFDRSSSLTSFFSFLLLTPWSSSFFILFLLSFVSFLSSSRSSSPFFLIPFFFSFQQGEAVKVARPAGLMVMGNRCTEERETRQSWNPMVEQRTRGAAVLIW
jgi:hypothetical protein